MRSKRVRARGVTLVELLAVVMIIGVMSAVIVPRLSGSIGRPGVVATMRRLALDCRHARVAAIATGTNHYVGFNAGGWGVFRRDTPSDVPIESDRGLLRGVDGVISAWNFEFDPTGASLAAYWCVLYDTDKPLRKYRLQVIPVTGTITVTPP